MTPGARVAAAIEILEDMATGQAAEQALTRWARHSRFAGSKDRAAIRDHVFDVLRVRRSAVHLGGGDTGRALMIGLLRHQSIDPTGLFTGDGHAPAPLDDDELQIPAGETTRADVLNLPDWLLPLFDRSLEAAADDTAMALQARAPITLRVNTAKVHLKTAQKALIDIGVESRTNSLSKTALTVTEGARKIRQSDIFSEGWIEFQDASSQAVVAAITGKGRALDYCAGGGGKALALAMDPAWEVFAHDIDPARMKDLPARALRAGATVTAVATEDLASMAPFDLVLCDAPCSGSGAWRRAPEGKWRLTPERLAELNAIQDDVLTKAAGLVAPAGMLAYATCSVLACENRERVAAFLTTHPGWTCVWQHQFPVNGDGDGFYATHLTRQ